MEKKYRLLKVAVGIFKALAWLAAALGLVSGIAIFSGSGAPETPRWMGTIALIVGISYLFSFLVASEVIGLLLEIKTNLK